MQARVFLLVALLISSLTACVDLSSDDDETSAQERLVQNDSPQGHWKSFCTDSSITGVASVPQSSEPIASYKIEQLDIIGNWYEKTIDYYTDDACLDFVDRQETSGKYVVEDLGGQVAASELGTISGITRTQFIEIDSNSNEVSMTHYINRSNSIGFPENTETYVVSSLIEQFVTDENGYYDRQEDYYLTELSKITGDLQGVA